MSLMDKKRLGILWFRNDLRLNDNLSLNKSIELIKQKKLDFILPFYCYDKLVFEGKSRQAELPKIGIYRRNFLIESVENLRLNLAKKLKSNLLISYGEQDVEIKNLIESIQTSNSNVLVDCVLAMKEIPSEEVEIENKLKKYLDEKKIKFNLTLDNTMIHIDDLSYGSVDKTPDMFTQFRKSVELRGQESTYKVRRHVELPKDFSLPTLEISDWGLEKQPAKAEIILTERSAIKGMTGGEDSALERMINYFFKTDGLFKYKTTRNGLVGTEYSSKLSMWLALGCISPRLLYWKVKEFEESKRQNESTKCLIFELLWRDFFKFHSIKFDKKIFYLNGLYSNNKGANNYSFKWKTDKDLFEKWCRGETGYPFVDANMKELNETGWMSNRGRQNVASFLTKDLEIDWRYGAEYFETMLIDYDCTSNWGNWQYVAGVGVDPRADRYFNVIKQAYDYDEKGDFVKLWLPQLEKCSIDFVHCPFRMSMVEQKRVGCLLGKDYTMPVVRMKHEWNPNARKINKFAAKSKRPDF